MTETDGQVSGPVPAERLSMLRRLVAQGLDTLSLNREPAVLYDPVRYVLEASGKQFRPLLVLLTAECWKVPPEDALPAALAVELFHNFTLVHDDIMDHSASRRGRPTVHTRWDESTAILSGDYLLALAYGQLARIEPHQLRDAMAVFHGMVMQLCEGQALDKAFEGREHVTREEYLHMIDGKTGALLRACLELGGVLGGASEKDRACLRSCGEHLGRAFQIQDDLLDLVAESEGWGKVVGSDLIEGKKAFLLLTALEKSEGDEARWFRRIVEGGGLDPAEVDEARERMARLGVLDDAREAVEVHFGTAMNALSEVSCGTEALASFIQIMQKRVH